MKAQAWWILALLIFCHSGVVHADADAVPDPVSTKAPETEKPTTPSSSATAVREENEGQRSSPAQARENLDPEKRAEKIVALMNGSLDPSVDPTTLFEASLLDPRAPLFLPSFVKKVPNEGALDDPLEDALGRFFEFPRATQEAFVKAQAKKHAEYLENEKAERQLLRQLEKTQKNVELFRAYLEKTLDPKVELNDILTFNALHLLGPSGKTKSETEARYERVTEQWGELLLRYARLSKEEKAALLRQHEANKQAVLEEKGEDSDESVARDAAVSAAEQRRAALVAASQARTEMARVLAEEKARLLGIQEDQARIAERLAQSRKETVETREDSFTWTRKVRELLVSSPFENDRELRAADLYDGIVQSLTRKRQSLREAIQRATSEPDVPGPGELAEIPEMVERKELDQLVTKLEREKVRLTDALAEWRTEKATILRTCVVEENQARLSLLPALSPDLRAEKLGFAATGVAQATREISQIELEARFHLLQLRDGMDGTWRRLAAQPLLILLVVVKLISITFVFRLWRRKAKDILGEIITWGTSRGAGPGGQLAATSAWYLERTRHPLEWLLYLTTFLGIFQQLGELPESRYIAELIMWLCIGSFATKLLDALAARQTKEDDRATLRYRSLRMIGLTLVCIILLMRLARLSVGTGTLYSWIGTASWFLILPIGLLLLSWWRPTVLELARQHHEPSTLMRWAAARKYGPSSFLATALAGAQLLYEGTYRFFLQRAANLQATQRLLAYLFRRELEKRSNSEEDVYQPLSEELRANFNRGVESHELLEDYAKSALSLFRSIVENENNSVVALVGERGLGKTTFIERAVAELDPREALGVRCGPGGYGHLLIGLRQALDLPPDAPKGELIETLRTRSPKLVWIDDAHHLIRPLIGGLRDFDQLAALAHEVGGRTCWLIGVRTPAWNYLQRARGDRAVVDSIISLPLWTEAEILKLTQRVSAAAGLRPRYDDLVVPRQIDVSTYGSSTEHTERDYGRILWDYSDGNPAVALHFFLHSLRLRDDTPHVRLFTPPSATNLEELPTSIYFVLRSIIQLGLAVEGDIVRCTGLSPSDVADALRLAKGRNYIEKRGTRFLVTIHWYRTISQFLRRQHLLIG